MKIQLRSGFLLVAGLVNALPQDASAQCCLADFFAGCGTCFSRPPMYAVAPVAAPVMAPVAAPAPPVMVPVQQTSYVPETTYRTEYKTVPVTTYKPSCEIDPCTGCARECMQPVTQYVHQAVNVPVTQYRAVTSTKYVQMQPGAAAPYAAPVGFAAPPAMPPAMPPAGTVSPFAAPVQTAAPGWGAANGDISTQIVPGQSSINPPSLPPGTAAPMIQQPVQRQISPPTTTTGTAWMMPMGAQPQAFKPPALDPAAGPVPTQPPALKPIPDMPRAGAGDRQAPVASPPVQAPAAGSREANSQMPGSPPASSGTTGIPVVPGSGSGAAAGAFPRLLEPTGHTTSWHPAAIGVGQSDTSVYPTAALPMRSQR